MGIKTNKLYALKISNLKYCFTLHFKKKSMLKTHFMDHNKDGKQRKRHEERSPYIGNVKESGTANEQ
jgi:hypothetical protein